MAAQLTATDEDIVGTGERLLKEGKIVTGWTIRSALGTGNGNRICQVWDAHLASKKPAEQAPAPLPEDLQTMLEAFKTRQSAGLAAIVRDIWRSAENLANGRLVAEIEAQRALVAQAEASLGAAQAAIDAAEIQRDAALADVERVRVGLNEALQNHIKVEIMARAAADRADKSDAARREMAAELRMSDAERGRLQGVLEGMKAAKSKAANAA